MTTIYVLIFAMAVFLASVAHSFTIPGLSSSTVGRRSITATLTLAKRGNSEFSVIEDNDDEDNADNLLPSDFTVLDSDTTQQQKEETSTTSATQSPKKKKRKTEYAALSPGTATTLQIQVGDLALARKAWKKRRRSGSPLLVPCSVLNMDRTSMLRGNIVFLLYKFGKPQKDGVVLSLSELKYRYKSHLQGQLKKHATELGYESPRELLEALFLHGKANQESWGARLISPPDEDEIYLKSPLSKYRALQKATQATLLQVTKEVDEGEELPVDTMKHTGYIRCKAEDQGDGGGDQSSNDNNRRRYKYPPLSAAIRVSQKEDVETGIIKQGSIHPAVFFGFDRQGDGGSPLLTLSLNPARKPTVKKTSNNNNNNGKTRSKYTPIRNPRHMIEDLKIGEGPFDAKVVRLGKGHALIDFGVGRKFSQHQQQQSIKTKHHPIGTPDFVKVYGMLRFQDAIDPQFVKDDDNHDGYDDQNKHSKSSSAAKKQSAVAEADVFASMEELLSKVDELDQLEDGEELEDITHLFSLNEDGSMNYDNPETGEIEIVNSVDDDEEDDDMEDDEEDDAPVTFDISDMSRYQPKPRRTMLLRVGDRIPVHILSVSKQSSQFMVTTDPSAVKGKKAKDIKKQSGVSKKLEKLSQMLGGLDKAEELKGREYRGTVKATSQTGDWLYVQAEATDDEEDLHLPVGVATIPEELAAEYEPSSFSQGDLVRIQLDGIDESRGQLAMRVIEKLSP